MKITVEKLVKAPAAEVWRAYLTPAEIMQWNAASDDWHTTASTVDLRVGGQFSSRMEAKDGSFGFDFAGVYTRIEPERRLEYAFGDRNAVVEFLPASGGVTVRLTGQVPLSDEEFNSLADGADLVSITMVAALLGILWLAVRSARITLAIVLTTVIGLIMTAAIGLLAVGRFNLISVAFIPLFVGLGVDFSIQFSVRSLAERLVQPTLAATLVATGSAIGKALALSAMAIGVGFFAFLPTSYVGVAELGTIAGLGMIIAFVLTVCLLPAFFTLLRVPAAGMKEIGFAMLAPVDRLVHRQRRAVLAGAALAAIAACALLPLLQFDFNPLNLKSLKVESMTTLLDMQHDPDWSLEAINVLAPSLADAVPLAHRLAALPEVSRVISLNTFVPPYQKEKMMLIGDAVDVVAPVLDVEAAEPATDEELQRRLGATAVALRQAATDNPDPASAAAAARRLADMLDRLKAAPPQVRAAAATAVVTPLKIMLAQVRNELRARPISLESLPRELVADWTALDGRVRLMVLPKDDHDNAALQRFAQAVQSVAPDATGWPISTAASGESIVHAFLQAGAYSFLAIVVLLAIVLRRVHDIVLTMLPVILSGLLTFGTCAALGLPLNFANIIALPLLFGVGMTASYG